MATPATPWLRDPPTSTQLRNDAVLGVVLAAVSVFTVELQRSYMPGADLGWQGVEGYLWAAGLGLVLCVRRRYPLSVLIASSLLFFGIGERLPVVGQSILVQICVFMALYAAWAWSRKRLLLRWVSGFVLAGMFGWLVWTWFTEEVRGLAPKSGMFEPVTGLALYQLEMNVIFFFGAIAWGIVSWRSAKQRAMLEAQAEELRREQEENASRAVAEERVRIARELHDVVAHHVSSIGVQAAGARRQLERKPESSVEALRTIENSSRTAVTEMHQLVGLLRTAAGGEDSDRAPRPGISEIEALAESARGDRLWVEYRTVGEPFEIADTTSLSLYRTAQEALANIHRHSRANRASVVLRYLDPADGSKAVEVEIIDNGGSGGTGTDSHGRESGGWGLQGIEERATLHGGQAEIGRRPDGGFRVRVRIPVEDGTDD